MSVSFDDESDPTPTEKAVIELTMRELRKRIKHGSPTSINEHELTIYGSANLDNPLTRFSFNIQQRTSDTITIFIFNSNAVHTKYHFKIADPDFHEQVAEKIDSLAG